MAADNGHDASHEFDDEPTTAEEVVDRVTSAALFRRLSQLEGRIDRLADAIDRLATSVDLLARKT